ncbi:hypothetical protein LTR08_008732 [Meristemomyces frigidus]|nr:hypothetical protein LTR08_008732 [Meristemomyces frigidus]
MDSMMMTYPMELAPAGGVDTTASPDPAVSTNHTQDGALASTPASTAPELQLAARDHNTLVYNSNKHETDAHLIPQPAPELRDNILSPDHFAPASFESCDTTRQEPTKPATTDAMADKEIKEGDEVSWQWSGGRPSGTVAEVADEGQVSVTSKKGNEIHRNAEPDNPAVKISRSGNDVVKKASELDVEEKGDADEEDAGEEKTTAADDKKADEEEAEENDDAQTGEKRKADHDEADDDKLEAKGPAKAKKQKTVKETKATNGEKAAPKKKGRPAKATNGDTSKTAAKETKKREPKKAATESGQPRRSGRNKA